VKKYKATKKKKKEERKGKKKGSHKGLRLPGETKELRGKKKKLPLEEKKI